MSCHVVPPTDIAMSDPQTLGWLFVLPQAEFQTLQLIIDVEGYILSSCPYLLFLNLFCCSAPVIGAMLLVSMIPVISNPPRHVQISSSSCLFLILLCFCTGICTGHQIKPACWLEYLECLCTVPGIHYRCWHLTGRSEMDRCPLPLRNLV